MDSDVTTQHLCERALIHIYTHICIYIYKYIYIMQLLLQTDPYKIINQSVCVCVCVCVCVQAAHDELT